MSDSTGGFAKGGVLGLREIMLTPGPVTLSQGVREALMQDVMPWGLEFEEVCVEIEGRLLSIAGLDGCKGDYEVVFNHGCGSFMIEAVIASLIPKEGSRTLVVSNGMYGERAEHCLMLYGRDCVRADRGIWEIPSADFVEGYLSRDRSIDGVWVVHCETSTGALNRLDDISEVVRSYGCRFFVDSVASFGVVEQKMDFWGADVVLATPNKCLEGAPGFAFACVKREVLERYEGESRTLGFDLCAQSRHFRERKRWRYTPPTHSVMAFRRALDEFDLEGGYEGRGKRYGENMDVLWNGMASLGFCAVMPRAWQSPVIGTFFEPADVHFDRSCFLRDLGRAGFLVFPGWQTGDIPSLRIAVIGSQVTPHVMERFMVAVEGSLLEMGVDDGVPHPSHAAMVCEASSGT